MERGKTSDKQQRTTNHITLPSRQVSSLISNDVFNIDAPANGAIRLNTNHCLALYKSIGTNVQEVKYSSFCYIEQG